jgi:Rad3-related DNA helicase
MAEVFAAHSIFDVSLQRGRARAVRSRLCLRNVVPAPFLRPRFDDAHSALLFSATLAPADFYREMLGLDESAATLDVASPFSPDQLNVQILDTVSTRYQHRQDSIGPIVERMAAQYRNRPGNYLAFFSSFDYLHAVAAGLAAAHPDVPAWQQVRSMSEAERAAFLERFQPQGRGIGFAVLGGAFAEGIDLPGSRLIGAFIATLGLPQLNPVNEQMKARLDALSGRGYEYTYLYPGLQKVVQAAGRIIRGIGDRGTLLLIDDRYHRPAVRALLPAWWQIERRPHRLEIREHSGARQAHPPIGL